MCFQEKPKGRKVWEGWCEPCIRRLLLGRYLPPSPLPRSFSSFRPGLPGLLPWGFTRNEHRYTSGGGQISGMASPAATTDHTWWVEQQTRGFVLNVQGSVQCVCLIPYSLLRNRHPLLPAGCICNRSAYEAFVWVPVKKNTNRINKKDSQKTTTKPQVLTYCTASPALMRKRLKLIFRTTLRALGSVCVSHSFTTPVTHRTRASARVCGWEAGTGDFVWLTVVHL